LNWQKLILIRNDELQIDKENVLTAKRI